MAGGESWDGSFGTCSPSGEGYHFDKLHVEPVYDAFICPLTNQLMQEPVTIENGMTFEREAIEKWFGECRGKLVCPLTLKELRTPDLNPNLSLMQAIGEWEGRNEAAQFEMAQRSLSVECEEDEVLQAMNYVQHLSQKGRPSNLIIRHAFPKIVNMLKSGSRVVRCKALQTLRVLSEKDGDSKGMMAEGDTVRTIVKFLSHELSKERGEAISLLYELSKSEALCAKVGSVNGAILILIGMASSKSERVVIIEKAEKTLVNLEICKNNILQMADNGRLHPLLMQLLNGEPETRLTMAMYLGDLVLSSEVKEKATELVGPSLVGIMRSGGGDTQSREAALKALYQMSSSDASSKLLVDSGILPPLIGHLFSVAPDDQLPTRLKEVCAAILSNIVASAPADLGSVPVLGGSHTLLSQPVVHNLLHLISNTSPAIEGKLLQVLVGLTAAPSLPLVAAAIRSSGAAASLVQFVEAPQPDLRLAAIKLLRNIAPHLGPELADALRGTSGQLGTLVRLISDASDNSAVSDEQAAAAGLLSDLPVLDLGLTRQMLDEGVFRLAVSRVLAARRGAALGSRFASPYLEGLVSVLARVTFALREEPGAVAFARDHNLPALFSDLLNLNGLDVVQTLSAVALENLSRESRSLTMLPEVPPPGVCGRLFRCCRSEPAITGVCRVHTGVCSARETFCLLEGRGVGALAALLDHANEKVLEASMGALLTLLEDGVDIEQGVQVLCEAEAVRAVLDVLLGRRAEGLRRKAVWAVERMLRTTEIAYQVSGDPNVSAALVEAFQHGEYETRQIAECALKHIDKLPTFSEIFSNTL